MHFKYWGLTVPLLIFGGSTMGIENLDSIFKPKSIAVIGASNKIGSAGYRVFRNLIGSGYEGVVYPINPNHESIQGVQAYPTVNDIPKVVDLAII